MELGEIAVNTFDGKLFIRGNNGSDFVNEISSISQGGGSNADTLDNLDSSQFLRSDANDIATGNINFTGDLTKDSNTVWHTGNQPFYLATNTNNVAGVWEATINDVTAYTDGLTVFFYPNKINGSSSGTTFQINSLGVKNIKRPGSATNNLTTHYHGSNTILLRYNSSDDCFNVHADYNTTADYNIRWNNVVKAGNSSGTGTAWHGYQLVIEGIDGKFYPATEGGSTANTNPVSTAELRVGGTILYYSSGTNIAFNADSNTSIYESLYTTSMEYWNNRDSGWAVDNKSVYLVANKNANGNFVLDNTSFTSFLTQDLPTSDDGKYYIKIGLMNDTYDDFRLEVNHPIYVYKDGMVREWGGYSNNSDKLDNQTGSYYLDYNNFSNTPTASEILTDIKSVDGSGSGLDADTVDGLEASQFLRSDASDTMSGKLGVVSSGTIGLNTEYSTIKSNSYLYVDDGSDALGFDSNEISGSTSIFMSSGGDITLNSTASGNVIFSVDAKFGASGTAFNNTSVGEWNTAYGWGDHASAGYASSLSDLGITSTAAELNILDVSAQSPSNGQALTYSTANGLEWGSVASDSPFVENDQTITTSYTVASGKNAQGIGPITISNGAIITVSTGSKLVIT
jgi:hypothetical protein